MGSLLQRATVPRLGGRASNPSEANISHCACNLILTTCLMRFLARVLSQHWPSMSHSALREPSYRDSRVIEARDMLTHLTPTSRRTVILRTRELISFEAHAQGLRKPGIGLPLSLCRITHPFFAYKSRFDMPATTVTEWHCSEFTCAGVDLSTRNQSVQTSRSHSCLDAYHACSHLNLITARFSYSVHSPLRRYAITYARLRHFIFSSPRNTLRSHCCAGTISSGPGSSSSIAQACTR